MSASCSTRHAVEPAGEAKGLEQLRNMTRNGVLPAEEAVTSIESAYPNSKVAGLARILRARIRTKQGDFAGGIALLDSNVIRERTALGDYALLMRVRALEQLNRRTEARADYEKLARDYPTSFRAGHALRRDAEMLLQDNQGAAVPVLLKDLILKDDAAALLLTAKAYEQAGDSTRALAAYRRIYFFSPASAESIEAEAKLKQLNSPTIPASAEEATARADKLYEAKRYSDAVNAYTDAFARFPATQKPQAQLRRGVAASNAKRWADAVSSLNAIPTSADERAEALFYLTQAYSNLKQWDAARGAIAELRRSFPTSPFAPRATDRAGEIARDAKATDQATSFFRDAVNAYPGAGEVAQAQFEIAWAAHDAKNYQESSRLLTEHLALYADKNTDNRGRAGYWAARDSERAGKLAEARALYEAMQARYNSSWYGYLSKQRLDSLRNSNAPQADFSSDQMMSRAIANLKTVTVAEETAGEKENERVTKADQLANIGIDDWAMEELTNASQTVPTSPRVNLAMAEIYRNEGQNLQAFNTLKKSYPDYSQMKPEELTREQFDKFGRIEYVAIAYNAGPGRVPQWRATLPLEMDEFAEAIPFKETRGYVQSIVRNTLQYQRLYDDNGQFRSNVGTRPVHPPVTAGSVPAAQLADETVIQRRFTGNERGE